MCRLVISETRRGLAAPACIVAILVATAGCHGEPRATEARLRPVRTTAVVASEEARLRRFSGTARATVEARLSFRVPGTVIELPVEVGDRVARDQQIARLDPRDYQLQLEDAAASLTQALASERNAAAEYERVCELYENDNASKSQLDQARAAAESAGAQAESIRKRLELAERQLGYTSLRAPIAGTIAAVATEVNENVQAGQTVVTMTSGTRPDVEVSIPENLIAAISQGDTVAVRFDALPERRFEAVIREVGVVASGSTTFPVTAQLAVAAPEVRPGMAAEVTFEFAIGGDHRIVVPPNAVGEDRGGRFAFVVEAHGDGTGTVRRRRVEIGELTARGLEVVAGLEVGDELVTAGVSQLSDGREVRLEGPAS